MAALSSNRSATIAIVIASQSIILGTYSPAWQAVQLSFWPRMNIVIYVPFVNWALPAELALASQRRQRVPSASPLLRVLAEHLRATDAIIH